MALKDSILASVAVMLLALTGRAWPALPETADGQQVPSLAPMLEQATPAVVNIATEGRIVVQNNPLLADPFFRRFFKIPDGPIERKTQALGSGVIVDARRGLVLTNSHVVANAVEITVTLRDGRHLQAEVVGTDPDTDVAVIKVPVENLTALPTANSDSIRVGDFVVAIGNPFGLGQTVTSGIISALGRSGLGIEGYEDFIQTDASINPGNSGGALVNLRGELVGINTAIFSQTGGNIGIGFAIPINMALQIMEQLVDTGAVERGTVGVTVQDLTPDLAAAFGMEKQLGAVVTSVAPDSPAATAGLQTGDIITEINKKPVRNGGDVRNHIGLLPLGEAVSFVVLREGKRKSLEAKVVAGTDGGAAGGPRAVNPKLNGVTVGNIDADHPLSGKILGVEVAGIEPGSQAWRSGLRQGDIITSVNHTKIGKLEDFLTAVDRKQGPLLFRVIRGNAAAFLVIK
ncbi:MAG: serine endoprotease DegQ [Gammaproteobacteria bacterium RIFCSPLOWO2_02_FULL_61_13]|nr:MAG: serine endoprotease DegQ [Gammaproteobacteria bacterium RIFCSPLOWO2_02_FULL_61_13]